MGYAPSKCPVCGSYKWMKVDKSKKVFSAGKADAGGVLLGLVGLLAILNTNTRK